MASAGRFCLVTSAHVSNNPRLVKEADALTAGGHAVRVVAVDVSAEAARRDATLMASRSWRLDRVSARRREGGIGASATWFVDAMLQRAAARARAHRIGGTRVRDRELSRHVGRLARAAAAEPADVVVAHNLEALPAAMRAARVLGARVAFDVEDLHSGDLPDVPANAPRIALLREVEQEYLRRCDLLLASSEGIADALNAAYAVHPVVVLNAFPLAARAIVPTATRSRDPDVPSLYWFSQTIGADRGIEDVVAAAGSLRAEGLRVQIHLRGAATDAYRSQLMEHARAHGVADSVHLWPLAPPDEMVALAAEHDVGLAVEQALTRNRALCVTNKILVYLAAGLAIAATDTPAQRRVVEESGGAGFTYRPGDVSALAASLRALLESPAALRRAKAAASAAAQRRFSWEREEDTLLRAYEGLLARSTSAPARWPRPAELTGARR